MPSRRSENSWSFFNDKKPRLETHGQVMSLDDHIIDIVNNITSHPVPKEGL